MPDFVNGLKSANDYLNNTKVGVDTGYRVDALTGTVQVSQTQFTMKELVCGILNGNGLLMPNIQVCLKINTLGIMSELMGPLYEAMGKVAAALDDFMAHTGIDAVLERLNGIISEVAAIANMINFCGTPVVPVAIPNLLANAFGSFTGAGMAALDKIGKMVPSEIGGCASLGGTVGSRYVGYVNLDAFYGGVFGDIKDYLNSIGSDNISDINNAPQNVIDTIVFDLETAANEINTLIAAENDYKRAATETQGGSTFAPTNDPTRLHDGIGVGIDMANMSFSDAQQKAMSIRSAYDSLKAYAVDEEGNNLFHYLLEPEFIALLETNEEALEPTSEQVPVYDYCGRIVGYQEVINNADAPTSRGGPADPSANPGAGYEEPEETSPLLRELQAEITDLKARLDALGG